MSYEGATYNEQRANLFKAQEHYDKSLETNRKEKYFVETVARTRDTIVAYQALDAMQRDDPKKQPARVVRNEAATPAPPPKAALKVIQAGDVIEMFTAGVGEDQIIDVIQNSPVDFDYRDKDTLVAIAKAKLPVKLQNELRKKVGVPLLGPPQAPAARTASVGPKAALAKKQP
jgi:hypothetical protein